MWYLKTAVAEDPVTTDWVIVFGACARYSRATSYSEFSRYDACAVPARAPETLCTWMAALGRTCAVRGLSVNWMGNAQLYEYCTRAGTDDSLSAAGSFVTVSMFVHVVGQNVRY